MSNTIKKATKVADTAIQLLTREVVLPGVVTTWTEADFKGALNDTVTARIQASMTARTRVLRGGATYTADDVTETSVDLLINKDVYSLAYLTDEELTLDWTDLVQQVTVPQLRAVAQGLENIVAVAMESDDFATANKIGWGGVADASSGANYMAPYRALVDARRVLNAANVPMDGRVVVMGSTVEAEFLKSDLFARADKSGSDGALRAGSIGRVLGMELVTSNAIDPENAYVLHPTAYVLGAVAPAVPRGATDGARASFGGLSIRQIFDYDPTVGRDRSLVNIFGGCTAVRDGASTKQVRCVKLEYFAGS